MIRRLKTRCCGSRMTTSTLLSGSKIGPCGICHRTEIHNTSGDYMDIYTVLLIVFLTFGIGFVLNRVIG
jgi:hypothetical protein